MNKESWDIRRKLAWDLLCDGNFPTGKNLTFYGFMDRIRRYHFDNRVGDLAFDIVIDPNFPKGRKSEITYYEYLESRTWESKVLASYREAYLLYEKNNGNPNNLVFQDNDGNIVNF